VPGTARAVLHSDRLEPGLCDPYSSVHPDGNVLGYKPLFDVVATACSTICDFDRSIVGILFEGARGELRFIDGDPSCFVTATEDRGRGGRQPEVLAIDTELIRDGRASRNRTYVNLCWGDGQALGFGPEPGALNDGRVREVRDRDRGLASADRGVDAARRVRGGSRDSEHRAGEERKRDDRKACKKRKI